MIGTFGTAIGVVLFLLALVAARFAIRTSRSPQGATGWVVFLLSFPLIALPAYAIFGGVYRMNKHRAPQVPGASSDPADIENSRLADLQEAVESRLTEGNDIELLIDGGQTFGAIFEAIDAAENEVLVQYYTLVADDLGQRLKSHLVAAAERGVQVRVLVDAMGSFLLSRTFIAELRDAGVDFRGNFSFRRTFYRLGLNFRDHRKTVVIDGKVGFTGGLNASKLYEDGGRHFDTWRDTFQRIRGPVVAQLRACFASGWKAFADDEVPEAEIPEKAGEMRAMHVSFGPTDQREIGTFLILGLIGKARHRLWLTTPYLVPPPEVTAALKLAAQRGIDVRIIVPRPTDKHLPWLAGRANFARLHAAGIRIFEYRGGFMHQKVILVDDDIASIGTVNLDFRSIMLNFEQTLLVEDEDHCARVADMLEEDLAAAEEYKGERQSLYVRLFAPVAMLLSPVL